jgi:hypothetical protein
VGHESAFVVDLHRYVTSSYFYLPPAKKVIFIYFAGSVLKRKLEQPVSVNFRDVCFYLTWFKNTFILTTLSYYRAFVGS